MADKNLPHIQLYIGDWDRDCNVLSLQAEMAWLRIIFKMHLAGKQSRYKISAKGLQNLWKCSANEVQEILDELRFENICEIREISGGYEFFNRRLERENELSEIRSKAAKSKKGRSKKTANPKQTSSKSEQNPDNDIDNDNDIDIDNEEGGVGETELPFSGNDFFEKLPLAEVEKQLLNPSQWKEQLRMEYSRAGMPISEEHLDQRIQQFFKVIRSDGEEYKSIKDAKKHFHRWLKIQIENQNNDKNGQARENFRQHVAHRSDI